MKHWIVIPFGLISFVSAVLFFVAEPMLGKMALPPLGGTSAVWNTCLLYFQATLLVGYLFALAASRLERFSRLLPLVGLGSIFLLGFVRQPFSLGLTSTPDHPATSLLWALIAASALPLCLVSATAPLTQHWFAQTGHAQSHDPYFLYASSNAGSLIALVAYPVLIEPKLSLSSQALIWRLGYGVFGALFLACALMTTRGSVKTEEEPTNDEGKIPTLFDGLRWIALSAIPSSLLLGVTTFLTTNLAAMPLLWVIPLAIYLVAFILAFASSTRPFARWVSLCYPWAALAMVLVYLAGFVHAWWIPLHLFAFLLGCLVCDVGLAGSRPRSEFATLFYLAIATGGLVGGVFNALVAPAIFNGLVEYPLAILGVCLVFPRSTQRVARTSGRFSGVLAVILGPVLLFASAFPLTRGLVNVNESLIGVGLLFFASGLGFYYTLKARRQPTGFALTIGAILLTGVGSLDPAGITLYRSRNFYGLVRVTVDRVANCRRLLHGGTLHGEQSLEPALRREPRTYFTKSGPIGDVFVSRRNRNPGRRVAIVGLGVGTLAAYADQGEHWTFYELDPAIVGIARDPSFFTYLKDSPAETIQYVTGDARVRIREAANHSYSLIVLDAFGSDAVPVHLVSAEAIQLYLSKLTPGGLLVFNLTNGFVDLESVMGLQARNAGLFCRIRRDIRISPEERRLGKQGSIWAVMGREEADLRGLDSNTQWQEPRFRAGARPWTDDYSDLASYLLILRRNAPTK